MKTYGIDLGTTYSCIAKLDDYGNVEVIRNQTDSSDTLASAVYFENEENMIIGDAAKDFVETDGGKVVQFAKRYIGKANAPKWEFFGKEFNPIDISAAILGRLKQIAEEQGEIVENVVITVPAYFGIPEREATRKAGELAGLNVLNLINEPTAAALSYCARQFQEERTILVYDLGGGTFDVTVVKMALVIDENGNESQKVKVIATGGNDLLGGKDWDDRLFNHILNACAEELGIEVDDIELESRALIRSSVEPAKKALTNQTTKKLRLNVNDERINIEISREEFENITKDLVDQTMGYVENLLASNGNLEIDTVLLVGGSTFMPMIRDTVEARFPGIVQIEDPNRAVAKGASIAANIIVNEIANSETGNTGKGDSETGESGEVDKDTGEKGKGGPVTNGGPNIGFEDQSPRSFGPGILNVDNTYVINNLIKMGDKMGEDVSRTYYTPANNMEMIKLRAFENMSSADYVTPSVDGEGNEQPTDPSDQVKLLGFLELKLPPRTPAGTEILVTMKIEASGLFVRAENKSTGDTIEATLKFEDDYDIETSSITQMKISGE